MGTVRVRLIITGEVQMVGFRSYTARWAQRLGLTGCVKNRPDGSVEVVLQGEAEQVSRGVEICRRGPTTARVEGVRVMEEHLEPGLDTFEIRR